MPHSKVIPIIKNFTILLTKWKCRKLTGKFAIRTQYFFKIMHWIMLNKCYTLWWHAIQSDTTRTHATWFGHIDCFIRIWCKGCEIFLGTTLGKVLLTSYQTCANRHTDAWSRRLWSLCFNQGNPRLLVQSVEVITIRSKI